MCAVSSVVKSFQGQGDASKPALISTPQEVLTTRKIEIIDEKPLLRSKAEGLKSLVASSPKLLRRHFPRLRISIRQLRFMLLALTRIHQSNSRKNHYHRNHRVKSHRLGGQQPIPAIRRLLD